MGGARYPGRRLRCAGRPGAGAYAVPAGSAHQDRADDGLGLALPSVIYVIGNAVVGEITPAAQRGALLAIGTAVGTSAGLLLRPTWMGSLIENRGDPARRLQHGVHHLEAGSSMLVGGTIGMALLIPARARKGDAVGQRDREWSAFTATAGRDETSSDWCQPIGR